jgi:MerR family transcriptional regulator/heat shock protein HspR
MQKQSGQEGYRQAPEQGVGRQRIPIRIRPDQSSLAPQGRPKLARQAKGEESGELKGLYIISVAARLLEMHPQTLRKYERLGLVSPSRTLGMLRLYSEEDIARLRLIKYLQEDLGLNLAGVEFTLNFLDRLTEMHRRLSTMAEAEGVREALEEELEGFFRAINMPFQPFKF